MSILNHSMSDWKGLKLNPVGVKNKSSDEDLSFAERHGSVGTIGLIKLHSEKKWKRHCW